MGWYLGQFLRNAGQHLRSELEARMTSALQDYHQFMHWIHAPENAASEDARRVANIVLRVLLRLQVPAASATSDPTC